jgi:adenylate kinase
LAGAPGSGKGTMTEVIKNVRGLSSEPIVCSDLLDSKEMREKKNKGDMIGDKEVVNLVFETLLDKKYQSGVILDGFPRTKVQAECISLLYDKMFALRNDFKLTIHKFRFRRPIFHILVLFCDETTSIERQVKRGQIAHKTKQLYGLFCCYLFVF